MSSIVDTGAQTCLIKRGFMMDLMETSPEPLRLVKATGDLIMWGYKKIGLKMGFLTRKMRMIPWKDLVTVRGMFHDEDIEDGMGAFPGMWGGSLLSKGTWLSAMVYKGFHQGWLVHLGTNKTMLKGGIPSFSTKYSRSPKCGLAQRKHFQNSESFLQEYCQALLLPVPNCNRAAVRTSDCSR